MSRSDGEGFDPHPGDPWHPSWSDGSEDDDLLEEPQPREGEDRAGFVKRMLGGPGEPGEGDDAAGGDASSEHLFDSLRGDDTDELAPATPDPVPEPTMHPDVELLGDVSFDAESAGSDDARWALDRDPDGHISDAVAARETSIARHLEKEEHDALIAELSYAAHTADEAEADDGGERAGRTEAEIAEAARAEATASLDEERRTARDGLDDAHSEEAADASEAHEVSLRAVAEVSQAASEAVERHLAAGQVTDAASDWAAEEGRDLEADEAAGLREREGMLLADETGRATTGAADAQLDHDAEAAERFELHVAADANRSERAAAEGEVAAALAAAAAEREREAIRLGTDDAATSFDLPEIDAAGFVFEAHEPGDEAAGVAGVLDVPPPPDVPAAPTRDVPLPDRPVRGWRRFLRRRRRPTEVPAVTTVSSAQALASSGMSDDRTSDDPGPRDEETAEVHLGEDGEPLGDDRADAAPAGPDVEFDDWLDDPDEAYAELESEETEEEITEWMAFTEGREPEADAPADEDGELTADLPATPVEGAGDDQGADDEDDEEEDTTEFLLDDDDDDEEEDDEAEVEDERAAGPVAEEPVADEADVLPLRDEEPSAVEPTTATPSPDIEDAPAEARHPADDASADIVELGFDAFEDFDEEDYLRRSSTRDHTGLAEAIARAEEEGTERVPLAASMPGLETGVVGFDDVAEAEGQFAGSAASPRASDLAVRVGSAVLLVAVFLASLLWRPALITLAVAVFLIAAGEFYTVLMQKGYRPLSLFGFLGVLGAALGTVVWGVVAIPMALALTSVVILLFFAVTPGRVKPLLSYSVTMSVAAWMGLGIFALPIMQAEQYRTLVLAAVAAIAIMDIASYFVGTTLGRNRLAPVVSPKKTWEGLVGGVVAVLLVGAVLHYFPPFDLSSGLVLGAVVAVFGPLGDLSVSVVKRSIGVKDMGSILPGHGGLLDRIDALLFVIPAAWAVYAWLGLL